MYKKWLQRIHKYLGIIAFLFLLMVSLSGTLLIISDDLNLEKSMIPKDSILNISKANEEISWKSYILSVHRGYYFGIEAPYLHFSVGVSLFILSLSGILLYIRKLQGKKKVLTGGAKSKIIKELKLIEEIIKENSDSDSSIDKIKEKTQNLLDFLQADEK